MVESMMVGTPVHLDNVETPLLWFIIYILERIQPGEIPYKKSKSLKVFINSLYTFFGNHKIYTNE